MILEWMGAQPLPLYIQTLNGLTSIALAKGARLIHAGTPRAIVQSHSERNPLLRFCR